MSEGKNYSDQHDSQNQSGTSLPAALPLRVLAGVTLIVVAVLLAYFPSLNGGFILDDNALLTKNVLIMASDGLWRFWRTTEAADYWPVSNSSLWIEWRLWGMNPAGYHVVNLILHIIESLLIWIILRKLSIPGAFLAAMIFAVHPVNVESVAWVAQRKDMLAVLFFLFSILFYLKLEIPCPLAPSPWPLAPSFSPLFYWLSLMAFLLAMLSKGSAAVLPVLLLGIIWWQRGTVPIFVSTKMGLSPSISRWDLVRAAPFFLIAVVLAAVNVWFQTKGAEEVVRTVSFTGRLLGAGGVVWFYLYKALLPIDLVFVYPQWRIDAGNLLWWLPLLAALAVTAVLLWYRESWSRPWLFAWGFFCVALVPVLGFTDVGFMRHSLVADHYQHIAIIGVIALAAALWSVWHHRLALASHRVPLASHRVPLASRQCWARVALASRQCWAANGVAILAVGTLAFLTWRQSGLYRDPVLLYQATLENNPDCWIAHNNLGLALAETLRPREAIEHYNQALCLNPDYRDAYYNLGVTFYALGQYQQAIENYEKALRLGPDYPEVHNNLGNAFTQIGRPQEASEHYRQALRLNPDLPEAHVNLANYLTNAGRLQEAIEHCEQALRLKPDLPGAYNNLGSIFNAMGQYQQAIEHYQQALRLKPDYVEAHNNLGAVLAQTGRSQEAIEHFRQALRLKPDFTTVYSNLALTYAKMHQSAAAVAAAEKALELARSQGQMTLAKKIENWLNSYRDGLQDLQNAPPPSPSAPPTP